MLRLSLMKAQKNASAPPRGPHIRPAGPPGPHTLPKMARLALALMLAAAQAHSGAERRQPDYSGCATGKLIPHSNRTVAAPCVGGTGEECHYTCDEGFLPIGRHVCQTYSQGGTVRRLCLVPSQPDVALQPRWVPQVGGRAWPRRCHRHCANRCAVRRRCTSTTRSSAGAATGSAPALARPAPPAPFRPAPTPRTALARASRPRARRPTTRCGRSPAATGRSGRWGGTRARASRSAAWTSRSQSNPGTRAPSDRE